MEAVFERVCDDLMCVNWSETDGSEVRDIIRNNIPKNKRFEFFSYVEKNAFNKFQRAMILGEC